MPADSINSQSGLFAATLAAFIAETYKSLLPDEDRASQTPNQSRASDINKLPGPADDSSTFHAPHAAIVVNTLWFLALLVSLACALLATLVQEWTRTFLTAQAHSTAVNLERQCLEQISVHMGAQHYGLGRIPGLAVGLLHASVLIFMAGLDVFLWNLHPAPAYTAVAATSVITACYIVASCLPLFDTSCPFRTPLTDLLVAVVAVIVVAVPGVLLYCFLLVTIGWYKVTRGPLNVGMRRALNPAALVSHLWWNPFNASSMWHALKEYHTRRKSEDPIAFAPYIIRVILGDSEQTMAAMSARKFKFIWGRVGAYTLEHPTALQYIIGTFVSGWSPELDSLFVGLRYNEARVARIAAALMSVQSVFAATAMLRLLQLVFQAENADDRGLRAMVGEDARWRVSAEIIRAFPTFAKQLAKLRQQEMQQYDTQLLAALSSFRTSLIRLLALTAPQHTIARECILGMFVELQRFDIIKLPSVAVDDCELLGNIFATSRDPVAELASRNALSLVAGAKESYWRGPWADPDMCYLHPIAPGTLRWPELFSTAAQRRRLRRPTASSCFRKLLADLGLEDWLVSGSALRTPTVTNLKPAAIITLRDLANMVDFGPHLPSTQHDVCHDMHSTSTTDVAFDMPSTPKLSKTEQGEER